MTTVTRMVIDRKPARAWEQARRVAEFTGPTVWMHADLHPGNLLVHDGHLAAVLDGGGLALGDPALDYLVALDPADAADPADVPGPCRRRRGHLAARPGLGAVDRPCRLALLRPHQHADHGVGRPRGSWDSTSATVTSTKIPKATRAAVECVMS